MECIPGTKEVFGVPWEETTFGVPTKPVWLMPMTEFGGPVDTSLEDSSGLVD